jgi:hypothetical protein
MYELDEQFAWWRDVQTGGWVLAYALVGVVLGHRSGWKIAKTIAQLATLWMLVVLVWAFALGRYGPLPSETMQGWRNIAMLSFVAVTWLILDALARRGRNLKRT